MEETGLSTLHAAEADGAVHRADFSGFRVEQQGGAAQRADLQAGTAGVLSQAFGGVDAHFPLGMNALWVGTPFAAERTAL